MDHAERFDFQARLSGYVLFVSIEKLEKRVVQRARAYVKVMSDETCPSCGAHTAKTPEKVLLHAAVSQLEESQFPSEAPTARRRKGE